MAGHHAGQGQGQGQPGSVSGPQREVSGVMYALEAAAAGAAGAATDEDFEEELMLNYKRVDDYDLDFFPDDLQPHPVHPMAMPGVPGMPLRPSAVCSGAYLGQQQQQQQPGLAPRSAGPMQPGRGRDSKAAAASLRPPQPPQSRFASVSTGYLPAYYPQMPLMYPLPSPPSPVAPVAPGAVGLGRPGSAGAGPPVVDWPQDRDAARRRLVRRTQIVEEFEDIPEHDYPPGQW